jgi:hypothetical protein
MVFGDFRAHVAGRTVLVECPDNDRGGAHLPPVLDESWMRPTIEKHQHLTAIEGPTIGGSYVFHWTGDVSDEEALFQSTRILKELY